LRKLLRQHLLSVRFTADNQLTASRKMDWQQCPHLCNSAFNTTDYKLMKYKESGFGFILLLASGTHWLNFRLLDNTLFYNQSLFWLLFTLSVLMAILGFYLILKFDSNKRAEPIFSNFPAFKKSNFKFYTWFLPLMLVGSIWLSGNILNTIVLGVNYCIPKSEIQQKEYLISNKKITQRSRNSKHKVYKLEIENGTSKDEISVSAQLYEVVEISKKIPIKAYKGYFGFDVIK